MMRYFQKKVGEVLEVNTAKLVADMMKDIAKELVKSGGKKAVMEKANQGLTPLEVNFIDSAISTPTMLINLELIST